MRELRIELEAKELSITEKKARRDKVHRPVHSTTEGLTTVEGLKYLYCQASHFPDKCDIATNIETRKALLKSQRRYITQVSVTNLGEVRMEATRKSSENSKIDDKNKETFTMLTNSIKNREIVLQSAVLLLKHPSTQNQIEGKMILDTGSQRS